MEEVLDLKKVYEELTKPSFFRSTKKRKMLTNFANLIGQKSSFAHKVHKEFNRFGNFPDDI